VLVESTDIRAYHLDAKYLEEEVTTDRQSEEVPIGNIVSSPMSCEMTRTDAVASADDKGSLPHLAEELVDGNGRKMAVVGMYLAMKKAFIEGSVVREIDADAHLIDSFGLLDSEGFFSGLSSSKI
jgi:hypothetical protein